tara:strand:+ start:813 stop:1463 length:651 start_codon:yes stop_codon:yes gene_type:complete
MISSNLKNRIFTSLILFGLIISIFIYDFILIFSLIIMGNLSILEFSNLMKKIKLKNYYFFFLNLIFITYVFLFCIIFYILTKLVHFEILLFTILLGCIASDIGGFVIGKIFKGPKLTKISPNKTISGAIGSLFLTSITFVFLLYYYTNTISLNIFFVGLIISVACQSGDLLFSFLKRKAKIKDTGNFLPGHGGFLDRLDGIFLGIPVGLLTFILIF